MKKLLSTIFVYLLLNGNGYSEEKQLIFLDCKHNYATSLKNPTPEDIIGQFSFTINKDSSSTDITALSSEDDVIYEGKSTPNKYLLKRMVVRGGVVMIEEVSIDRINGQMINETKMFVDSNTDPKKPDAVTYFYINCKIAKTKF